MARVCSWCGLPDPDWLSSLEPLGTALKPAFEPIVVARKPLMGPVAANVLTWGTGALNIDATRVPSDGSHMVHGTVTKRTTVAGDERTGAALGMYGAGASFTPTNHAGGRWPANVLLDGDAAEELDAGEGGRSFNKAGVSGKQRGDQPSNTSAAFAVRKDGDGVFGYGDSGGPSRFFPTFRYQAKAPTRERPTYVKEGVVDAGNTEGGARPEHFRCQVCGRTKSGRNSTAGACECSEPQWERRGAGKVAHPTVKPLALMRWLVRLVTPPGGTVLDPFAGSGATVEAAMLEGFRCVAIERDADYLPLIGIRVARSRVSGATPLVDAPAAAPSSPGVPRSPEAVAAQLDLFEGESA